MALSGRLLGGRSAGMDDGSTRRAVPAVRMGRPGGAQRAAGCPAGDLAVDVRAVALFQPGGAQPGADDRLRRSERLSRHGSPGHGAVVRRPACLHRDSTPRAPGPFLDVWRSRRCSDSPWCLRPGWSRNAVVLHRFVPLSANSGIVLFDGTGGGALTPAEQQAYDADRAAVGLTTAPHSDASAWIRIRADWRANPLRLRRGPHAPCRCSWCRRCGRPALDVRWELEHQA